MQTFLAGASLVIGALFIGKHFALAEPPAYAPPKPFPPRLPNAPNAPTTRGVSFLG